MLDVIIEREIRRVQLAIGEPTWNAIGIGAENLSRFFIPIDVLGRCAQNAAGFFIDAENSV